VQDAAAHQFLDALGGVVGSESGRPEQQGKIEVTADDGSHRGDVASAIGQALETSRDRVADRLWQRVRPALVQ
jgi:hypothetical protein